MADYISRLVQNEDMLIFKYNVQGNILRRWGLKMLGHGDLHPVIYGQNLHHRCGGAVYHYRPGLPFEAHHLAPGQAVLATEHLFQGKTMLLGGHFPFELHTIPPGRYGPALPALSGDGRWKWPPHADMWSGLGLDNLWGSAPPPPWVPPQRPLPLHNNTPHRGRAAQLNDLVPADPNLKNIQRDLRDGQR